jgi:hypothetical protein
MTTPPAELFKKCLLTPVITVTYLVGLIQLKCILSCLGQLKNSSWYVIFLSYSLAPPFCTFIDKAARFYILARNFSRHSTLDLSHAYTFSYFYPRANQNVKILAMINLKFRIFLPEL